MYKSIFVWKRRGVGEAIVYCCFERLRDGMFCVQNSNGFSLKSERDQWKSLLEVTGELFLDEEIDLRAGWFPSLEAAIGEHDGAFQ